MNRVSTEQIEKDSPRFQIIHYRDAIKTVLSLMNTESPKREEYVKEVLSLLEKLPMVPKLKEYLINNIKSTKEVDWAKTILWDNTNISNFVYYLMCIDDLLHFKGNHVNEEQVKQEKEEKMLLCQRFVEKSGLTFLHKVFVELSKKEMCNELLKHKAVFLILKLVKHFLNKQNFQYTKAVLNQKLYD